MTAVSANMVTVYVFRRGPEFLQLLRSKQPMMGTWQPVAGGIEDGETAAIAALRELREETGLRHDSPAFVGFWKLDWVHPFFMPSVDTVVLSPSFAVEVSPGWSPVLNAEHTDSRWVGGGEVAERFMWAGQVASCREVIDRLLRPGSLSEAAQRLEPRAVLLRRGDPP